jgi:hypothetical protein
VGVCTDFITVSKEYRIEDRSSPPITGQTNPSGVLGRNPHSSAYLEQYSDPQTAHFLSAGVPQP